jgi:hypothetical protein
METDNLKILRDKCLLFNQFMIDKGFIPGELIVAYQETNKLIEEAYQERKIKPLRAASNDIDDQVIRHMPLSIAMELKKLFKERLNFDFEAVDKARLKSIEKVLKKGKVNNPQEYELLLNRVDELHLDVSKTEDIERLNNLLITYDKGK